MADEEMRAEPENGSGRGTDGNGTGHDGTDNNSVDNNSVDNNRRNGDTKLSLTLRMLVAAYVLYLAYGLIRDFGKNVGTDRYLIGAAIIIFVAAGGALLILSARKLIRKEYIDAEEDEGKK